MLLVRQFFRAGFCYKSHNFEIRYSESSVSRIITRVEEILTESKEFALPGKRRADLSPEIEVVVDVVETVIERPKKNKSDIIRARKSGTR